MSDHLIQKIAEVLYAYRHSGSGLEKRAKSILDMVSLECKEELTLIPTWEQFVKSPDATAEQINQLAYIAELFRCIWKEFRRGCEFGSFVMTPEIAEELKRAGYKITYIDDQLVTAGDEMRAYNFDFRK